MQINQHSFSTKIYIFNQLRVFLIFYYTFKILNEIGQTYRLKLFSQVASPALFYSYVSSSALQRQRYLFYNADLAFS